MPLLVKIILIVSCLPLLAMPKLISLSLTTDDHLLWFYPFDVILSVLCAWRAWGRRPEVSWIIIGVLWLTHIAVWFLVDPAIIL